MLPVQTGLSVAAIDARIDAKIAAHEALSDPHAGYALLAGRAGGQTLRGAPESLGAELAPNLVTPDWTLGAGWAYGTSPDRLVRTASGGTKTAVPAAAPTIVAGAVYKIVVQITVTAGGCRFQIGGRTRGGVVPAPIIASGTYTMRFKALTTGTLQMEAETDASAFEILALSCKADAGASAPINLVGLVDVLRLLAPLLTVEGRALLDAVEGVAAEGIGFDLVRSTGGDVRVFAKHVKSTAKLTVGDSNLVTDIRGGDGVQLAGLSLADRFPAGDGRYAELPVAAGGVLQDGGAIP